MSRQIDLALYSEFDWDQANREKNWMKHKVDYRECEQAFGNHPKFISLDATHSQKEERFSLLGLTNTGRMLTITFTVRGPKIRVISARDQSKRERAFFQKAINAEPVKA